MTLATILLIAETITFIPGNALIPGTITSSKGTAVVHQIPGGYSISTSSSKVRDWYHRSGYCCSDQSTYDPDKMPRFDASKKCRLCRGTGNLGNKSKCKCIRSQEKDWKEWRAYCKKNNITGEAYVPVEWKKAKRSN